MDLTRRQIAIIFVGLYCAGGAFLLSDYLNDHTAPGAHLPLAWHVFPISVAVTIIALLLDSSAPLDPVWYVPVGAVATGFLAANCLCAFAVFKILGGPRAPSAENNATTSVLPEN